MPTLGEVWEVEGALKKGKERKKKQKANARLSSWDGHVPSACVTCPWCPCHPVTVGAHQVGSGAGG